MEPAKDKSALICAPFGQDAVVLQQCCQQAGLEPAICPDGQALGEAAGDGFMLIMLTEEACVEATIAALHAIWQARPIWSNPPLILLLDNVQRPPLSVAGLIADQAISTSVCLKRPVRRQDLLDVIKAQVDLRRRQYRTRDLMADLSSSQARSELILRELRHRIGNMLSTLGALLHMTANSASDVEEFQEAFRGRLEALGTAHQRLAISEEDALPFGQLVEDCIRPFSLPKERLLVDGPDLVLGPKAATSMAMILHELITNAQKYGALSNESGVVSLSWSTSKQEGSARPIRLEWREEGGPPVSKPERTGFGSVMLEQVAGMEFGGSTRLHFEDGGLRFVLEGRLET